MEPAPLLVGIDLGTTNSLCALFEDGQPRLIPNAHGAYLTPSAIAVLESGEVVVGETAKELCITKPGHAVAGFKRWMGEQRKVEIGGRSFDPTELSSLLLRSLKQDAEAHCKREVSEAVITVPAYFNEAQRRATKAAGEMAGLKVRRVINEPTAAALVHGYHEAGATKNLLVFDLGGGTFDVTVMEIFEGTLEILSTAGEAHLGGEDFTDRLLSWALGQEGYMLESAEMQQPLLVARLRAECEKAKRAFGTTDSASVRFPNHNGELDSGSKQLAITEALFEDECSNLLKRLEVPTKRALRDARKTWANIDDVLMVGGATRMPIVQRLVGGLFGRLPRTDFDPDRIVALGASIQAALIQDDAAVEDLVLTDVCPFTLGVEVMKEIGKLHREGYFSPIIHRNTTIPVSKEEFYYTVYDNQRELLLRVFQGESRRIDDNLELGSLNVTGIPPGPAGQMLGVRFTYDLNGLLEVVAYMPETDLRFQVVLQHQASGLSDEEIAAALKKMQEVKFYPRDDLENQRLLRFGERVVPELDRFQRGDVEQLIDSFERALSGEDREFFQVTRDQLVEKLGLLGFPFQPGENS